MTAAINIVAATEADIDGVRDIYAYYVKHTSYTFDDIVPEANVFAAKISSPLPFLVAKDQNEVIAYVYASPFSPRAAYARSVELSIYVRHGVTAQGLGTRLLKTLEYTLQAQGMVVCLANITDNNQGSIRFHQKHGYKQIGHFPWMGYKFGRWCGIVYFMKLLNDPYSVHP